MRKINKDFSKIFIIFIIILGLIFGTLAFAHIHKKCELSPYIDRDSVMGMGLLGFQEAVRQACKDAQSNKDCESTLSKSCDKNDMRSCVLLGLLYTSGLLEDESSSDERKQKGRKLFKKACDTNYGSGCLMLDKSDGTSSGHYSYLACEYGDYLGCLRQIKASMEIIKSMEGGDMMIEIEDNTPVESFIYDLKNETHKNYQIAIKRLQYNCKQEQKCSKQNEWNDRSNALGYCHLFEKVKGNYEGFKKRE